MSSFQAPRGTFDVLPADAARRAVLESHARRILGAAGYRRIETPAFEATELFSRGVGEATDIVQKEMYTFDDGGGRSLTLRPEGTAPVCRAYLEHGMHKLPQPVKLWYLSSFFRAEAPQRGRYRQFWQVGAEAIGSDVSRDRRRADPAAVRAAAGARRPGDAAATLEPGHAGHARRVPRGADGLPARARGPRSHPRWWRASTSTRCGRSTPATPPRGRRCATRRRCWTAWPPRTPSTSPRSAGCSTTPALSYELDPRWCAAWTTTRGPCSSSPPTRSARSPEWEGAGATTD